MRGASLLPHALGDWPRIVELRGIEPRVSGRSLEPTVYRHPSSPAGPSCQPRVQLLVVVFVGFFDVDDPCSLPTGRVLNEPGGCVERLPVSP